jgi:hypothetical protein
LQRSLAGVCNKFFIARMDCALTTSTSARFVVAFVRQ